MRRLSCIIPVGPKCNHMCPYKRETEIWPQERREKHGHISKETERFEDSTLLALRSGKEPWAMITALGAGNDKEMDS